VLQGLRALQIEEQAKQIFGRVDDLRRHLAAYEDRFKSVGKHLDTVVNQYNLSSKEYAKIDKDFLRIAGTSNQFDAVLVEKASDAT
jgi:DNA recombination protein RmuC